MALHYLDPEREPRMCPGCRACKAHIVNRPTPKRYRSNLCNGTGRLGVEGAEPELDLFQYPGESEWFYMTNSKEPHRLDLKGFHEWCVPQGPYPTEAAALAAARKADREGR